MFACVHTLVRVVWPLPRCLYVYFCLQGVHREKPAAHWWHTRNAAGVPSQANPCVLSFEPLDRPQSSFTALQLWPSLILFGTGGLTRCGACLALTSVALVSASRAFCVLAAHSVLHCHGCLRFNAKHWHTLSDYTTRYYGPAVLWNYYKFGESVVMCAVISTSKWFRAGLIGFSHGALLTLQAAVLRADDLRAAVVCAPVPYGEVLFSAALRTGDVPVPE